MLTSSLIFLLEKSLSNISEYVNNNFLKNEKKYVDGLKTAYNNQNLVLVLGAGVSLDYGLPSWNNLLKKLLIRNFESKHNIIGDKTENADLVINLFSLSPIILARDIQQQYKDNPNFLSFESDVRDIIYEELNDSKITSLFKEIRQFCIAPGMSPNLDSIITFNYDDMLENCLSQIEIDIPFKSIYAEGMQENVRELPIYHVHGYLPRKSIQEELNDSNKITLGESIYHQMYTDIYGWSSIVQINKYTKNVCLFIGTSFTDPNLRRLLDVAKKHRENNSAPHYLFKKRYDKSEIKKKILEKMEKGYTNIVNTTQEEAIIPKENFDFQLEIISNQLINIMENFDEEDALSFGVNIIWIDDYTEIPGILNEIRTS